MRLPTENTKDQLRTYAEAHGPTLVVEASVPGRPEKPPLGELELWTYHLDEVEPASFAIFRNGELEHPKNIQAISWAGPFSGRPELIAELFPQLEIELAGKAPRTVKAAQASLRSWWRLLDGLERDGATPVRSVADFFDVHRQKAFDAQMSSKDFSWFVNRIVNPTRAALRTQGKSGVGQLHWKAPERPTRGAADTVVPETQVVDPIRMALKHGWFAALHRWERTETLLELGRPRTMFEAGLGEETSLDGAGRRRNAARLEEEAALLKQYEHYVSAWQHAKGRVPLSKVESWGDLKEAAYSKASYNSIVMQHGFFPNGNDIRMAFMLCLAATGWNPQSLLDLDATRADEFIVEHPRNDPEDTKGHQYLMIGLSGDTEDAPPEDEDDVTRYSMTGWKDRAKHEVYTEGLKKSRASAPVIVLTLIKRTAPLRERLKEDLVKLLARYHTLQAQGADAHELRKVHKRLGQLQQGIRSPWLFISLGKVRWLDTNTFDARRDGRWLRYLIDTLNAQRPADRQLPYIVASDFRKIFGNYWYRTSNGDILQVKKALNHNMVRTTQTYVTNNVVLQQCSNNWRMFLGHLWDGVETGVVDPTLLAKLCKDGKVTDEEKRQLVDYRQLQRSRIGVPCRDPHNPPKDIDPTFVPDGKNTCVAQRCTLCLSNAILAPDSWPGLCMRLAELRFLQATLPMEVFSTAGSFRVELDHTERAVLAFPDQQIEEHVELWMQRIASGEHVPPELL
jgi:hypothetical protein